VVLNGNIKSADLFQNGYMFKNPEKLVRVRSVPSENCLPSLTENPFCSMASAADGYRSVHPTMVKVSLRALFSSH
jgi:hypothetical protein